ncbi:MAG: chorismate-binding protein, partial [Thermodesulfovibrio sp.]|nr:chorismate-binding protein [Thermodesulfovibrio sp.]
MLILCGSWLGQRGFFEAEIEEIRFFQSLAEIGEIEPPSFAVFSYDLSGETLKLKLKKTELPPVIIVKIKKLKKIKKTENSFRLSPINKALKDEEYLSGVQKIRKLIEDGTVYQINLTNRFDFKFHGDPESLFFHFFNNQHVPYGFCLNSGEIFILSGSME